MENEELLPKPQKDLPLPEKELQSPQGDALRKKLILLGLIFVILLAIIGGAYFLGRNSVFRELNPSNPVPPPPDEPSYQTPTPDPTADWKTFVSKYGYSFKYPPNLVASDVFSDTDVTTYYTEISNKGEINKKYGIVSNSNKNYFNMVIVYDPDLDTDIQTLRDQYSTDSKGSSVSNLTIGNEPGFKVKIDAAPNIRYLYIITVHNKKNID